MICKLQRVLKLSFYVSSSNSMLLFKLLISSIVRDFKFFNFSSAIFFLSLTLCHAYNTAIVSIGSKLTAGKLSMKNPATHHITFMRVLKSQPLPHKKKVKNAVINKPGI